MAVPTVDAPAGAPADAAPDVSEVPAVPSVVVNGRERRLGAVGGHVTLLDWLRAEGLTVLDPALSLFTAGGGGPHCLTCPLHRAEVAVR